MEEIHSVSEYLGWLSDVKQIHSMTHTVSSYTFFRGQANMDWKLSPSLYRKGLFKSENLLLTEIKHISPNEMLENRFDTLVKMQHFGMPTRLLDMTTNPLVALYFACENDVEMDCDGAVYVFPNLPVSWSTDPFIELIMDFVFDYYPENVCLDEMLKRTKIKYSNVIHRAMPDDINLLLHYLTLPAFAVMPAKTNERIEAQDGTFFIFGMSLRERYVSNNIGNLGKVYYNFDPVSIEKPGQIWKDAKIIRVPASEKNIILEQLDILGINEKKLFPDLSHQISHAVNTIIKNIPSK